MALGLVAALLAAACYETGYVLQALEARRAPAEQSLRASLLVRLLSRPRWLIGTALSLAGAGLQVLALAHAPVTLVQPVLALGLVALLVFAHTFLGERVGRLEVLGAAAVIAGVVMVGVASPPETSTVTSRTALIAILAPLVALNVAPFVLRATAPLALAAAGAAAGDAVSAVALKLTADAANRSQWGLAVLALAGAGATGLSALTAEMSALRGMPASRVAPMVIAAQVVVPAVVAMAAFGEPVTVPVVLGVLLAGGGAAVLGASRAVLTLREPEAVAHDSGGGGEVGEGVAG